MLKTKAIETQDNIYKITYERIFKTSYEQQRDKRNRSVALIIQKLSGVLLIALFTLFSLYIKDATAFIISVLIGSILIFSSKLLIET